MEDDRVGSEEQVKRTVHDGDVEREQEDDRLGEKQDEGSRQVDLEYLERGFTVNVIFADVVDELATLRRGSLLQGASTSTEEGRGVRFGQEEAAEAEALAT